MKAQFIKSSPDAVTPTKGHRSDSGYDLTLLKVHKKIGNVTLYDTGIQVCPPCGYYFDLVPRSSVIKSGYMLANSVGVIDADYRGNIYVPLIKLDESMPDLELPKRLMQLIPRKVSQFEMEQVETFEETARGDGGFGSTG